MNRPLRIGMGQINPVVGDLEGNCKKIGAYLERARDEGILLVTFPELAVTGYPPEDLLLKPSFVRANVRSLRSLISKTRHLTCLIGFAHPTGNRLYNAAALLHDRRWVATYHKNHLPNYGVFDEKRYFEPGKEGLIFSLDSFRIGVNICEDIWVEKGPPYWEARAGANVLINLSASPYHAGKGKERRALLVRWAKQTRTPIFYNNLVGGQDELVFDGQSLAVNSQGRVFQEGPQFQETLVVTDLLPPNPLHPAGRGVSKDRLKIQRVRLSARLSERSPLFPKQRPRRLSDVEEVYGALVLGTRDYVLKNGFRTAVLGLSGGIDSSLVACIAADAIGKENVVGVSMPSRYSSSETQADAERLARNLGIRFLTMPIERIFQAYLEGLKEVFQEKDASAQLAEENLQARIRGTFLMALSNRFGWLVLTTGNKSETSTGYCTLYGDMAGGFAVIKDVPKTLVYSLSRFRESRKGRPVIPESVLAREPTAELKPNQKDSDTLPPYDVLDPILKAYVEKDLAVGRILKTGVSKEIVQRVVQLVDRNEYKRRQAPPGVKITPRAFGRDRRFPITNRFREGL